MLTVGKSPGFLFIKTCLIENISVPRSDRSPSSYTYLYGYRQVLALNNYFAPVQQVNR